MATSIEDRVVQMKFDNSGFERNASTTLGTLSKLKESLNFSGSVKNLDELSSAANSVSFSGLSNGVETITAKFNTLQMVAINVISNIITNGIYKLENAIKSLSLDQITAGFSKYEDKTTAVQTIMSATASTWQENANKMSLVQYMKETEAYAELSEDALGKMAEAYLKVSDGTMTAKEAAKEYGMSTKELKGISEDLGKATLYEGSQMEFVSDQLQKLNWFSDETSFSFTDMTNNIGKFTSAGVGLTDAVEAMQGISTWAAKSGAGVNEASRAMYNLSQALGTGSVKLIDWKSIENANMATMEFKQTAIETAEKLGTLKKVSDGVWQTIDKGTEVTVKNFNNALSEGWFSSDVLMSTLSQYGKTSVRLSQISSDYDVTASKFLSGLTSYNEGTRTVTAISNDLGVSVEELIPLFEEMNQEEYKLGLASFRAAQEAKTFTEAISATTDAVSTGWMNIFETIFGNYEEAKVVWTDLANDLWDIFAGPVDDLSSLISDSFRLDGTDKFKIGLEQIGVSTDSFIQKFSEIDGIGNLMNAVEGDVSEALTRLKNATDVSDEVEKLDANFRAMASAVGDGVDKMQVLNDFGYSTGEALSLLDSYIKGDIKSFDELSSSQLRLMGVSDENIRIVEDLCGNLKNVKTYSKTATSSIRELAIANAVGTDKVEEFAKKLQSIASEEDDPYHALAKSQYNSLEIMDLYTKSVNGEAIELSKLSNATLKSIGYTDDEIDKIKELKTTIDEIDFGSLADGIDEVEGRTLFIEGLRNALLGLEDIMQLVKDSFREFFPATTSDQIYSALKAFNEFTQKLRVFDDEGQYTSDFWEEVGAVLEDVFSTLAKFKSILSDVFGIFKNVFVSFRKELVGDTSNLELFVNAWNPLVSAINTVVDKIADFISGIKEATDPSKPTKFHTAVQRIVGIFNQLKDIAGDLFGTIKNLFGDIGIMAREITPEESDVSIWEKLADAISTVLEWVKRGTAWIRDFTDPLKLEAALAGESGEKTSLFAKVLVGLTNALKLVVTIGKGVVKIIGDILSGVAQIDVDSFDAFIASVKEKFAPIQKILLGIGNIFKGLWDMLSTFAPAIQKIGEIIGNAFSKMGDAFKKSFTTEDGALNLEAITSVLTTLFSGGALALFAKGVESFEWSMDRIYTSLTAFSVNISADAILKIAGAVGILALSIIALASVDADRIGIALGAVSALVGELGGLMFLFSQFGDKNVNPFKNLGQLADAKAMDILAMSMLKLAAAVLVLAISVKLMSSIDPDRLESSFLAVEALLISLTGVAYVLSNYSGKMSKGAAGILSLSLGVLVLAAAMKIIATMSWEEIAKGLCSVVILLAAVALAVNMMPKGMALIGVGMIGLAVGILILAGALKVMATMSWEEFGKSMAVLAGSLLILTAAMLGMQYAIPGAAALLVASIALIALAAALKILASVDDGLAKAVGTIAAVLGICAVGLTLMIAALPGAIALGVFAVSLTALIPSLIALGKIKWSTIGAALAKLAVTLISLSLMTIVLAPFLAVLTALSVIVVVISAAVGGLALGIGVLSAALAVLSTVGASGMTAFVNMLYILVTALAGLTPAVMAFITALVVGILKLVIEVAPKLVEAVVAVIGSIITGVLEVIIIAIPKFVETVVTVFIAILNGLMELLPVLGEYIITFVKTACDVLRTTIPMVAGTAFDIVIGILNVFTEKIPNFVQAGWDLILALINGIADGVEGNAEALRDAVIHLGTALINGLLTFFGLKSLKEPSSGGSSFGEAGETLGKDFIHRIKDSITSKIEEIKEVGKNVINGLRDGIESAKESLFEKASSMASNVVSKLKTVFDVHSPSRVTHEIGKFVSIGLANGLSDYADAAVTAAEDMGGSVVSSLGETIKSLSETIEENVDTQPTIKPVLDLSEIEDADIDGSLKNKSLNLSGSIRNANLASISTNGMLQNKYASQLTALSQNGGASSPTYSFVQNNYSPKSLDSITIYRQTQNQFSRIKESLA